MSCPSYGDAPQATIARPTPYRPADSSAFSKSMQRGIAHAFTGGQGELMAHLYWGLLQMYSM